MAIVIEERRGTNQAPPANAGMGLYYSRRVSWSSLWAGAFTAMALQLLCGLLGVWAAPGSPTLLAGEFPLAGIPWGVGLWYLVFTIGAFYIGGGVAARAAGTPALGGVTHGFMTWAFANILGFFALALFAARNVVGLAGPVGNVVTAASAPGLALVSPGWMFGGLLLGLLAAVAGGRSAASMTQ